MNKAVIKRDFLTLFLYESKIVDDQVEVDYDCLGSFGEGTEVEILREIPVGEYAENQRSYVVLNPMNNESITVAGSFLDFSI